MVARLVYALFIHLILSSCASLSGYEYARWSQPRVAQLVSDCVAAHRSVGGGLWDPKNARLADGFTAAEIIEVPAATSYMLLLLSDPGEVDGPLATCEIDKKTGRIWRVTDELAGPGLPGLDVLIEEHSFFEPQKDPEEISAAFEMARTAVFPLKDLCAEAALNDICGNDEAKQK